MRAHLGNALKPFRWLFEPGRPTSAKGRAFLLAQLLGAPAAALMGSFCSVVVLLAANARDPSIVFDVLLAVECCLAAARVMEWRLRKPRLERSKTGSISVDISVGLSVAWCCQQGVIAFLLLSGDDPVLQVLSATLIMALVGPICARNYAAPRYAFMLVLITDLPFVAGAALSSEPTLKLMIVMTPAFLLGAMSILVTFHRAILTTLEAEEENRRLASHDALTGILNRKGMDDALQNRGAEGGRAMAMISIDLDGFKQVNDTYGHGVGDLVLVEVARRIRSVVRETDLTARIGGDEFTVMLWTSDADVIAPIARSLVAEISNRPIAISPGRSVSVGASIGYACLPQDAKTPAELWLNADLALYQAKGAGKRTARRYKSGTAFGAGRDLDLINSHHAVSR